MPSTVIFTLSPAASYTTVLFFGAFGAIFDLASFSFQVPVNASSAKHTAAATKHSTRVNTIIFVFMSSPDTGHSSAASRIQQLALRLRLTRLTPYFARSNLSASQPRLRKSQTTPTKTTRQNHSSTRCVFAAALMDEKFMGWSRGEGAER